MDDAQLMAKVIAVARSASDAILEIYRRADIEVSNKSDCSPLTLADLAADRVIRDGIAALDLGYPILTEETAEMTYDQRQDWQKYLLLRHDRIGRLYSKRTPIEQQYQCQRIIAGRGGAGCNKPVSCGSAYGSDAGLFGTIYLRQYGKLAQIMRGCRRQRSFLSPVWADDGVGYSGGACRCACGGRARMRCGRQ